MSQIKTFKSYAKVNLGLKVLDLLPDNYHSIFTIMQEIDFYDTINIQKNNQNKINLFCDGSVKVPIDRTNLCYKAAELIFNNCLLSSIVFLNISKSKFLDLKFGDETWHIVHLKLHPVVGSISIVIGR